jgi:Rod binding domain-containing protein
MNISAIASSLASPVAAAGAPAAPGDPNPPSAADLAQRKKVAGQFEAILVRQLLSKSVGAMLGGDGNDVSGSVYGDMMTDTLAQNLTAGPGLGLGRMIEKQLSPAPHQAAPQTSASP